MKNPIRLAKSSISTTTFDEAVDMLLSKNRPVIICDDITYGIAAERISKRAGIRAAIIPYTGKVLVPDEKAVAYVNAVCDETGADYILAVGSGVINDIGKYVSYERGVGYSVFATAPSMDGYASSSAAMLFGGLKTTFPAHVPDHVFADPGTLAAAPLIMRQGGAGDIIGKLSCLNDWRLSNIITGEALDEDIYNDVMREALDCVSYAPDALRGDVISTGRLMSALINVGNDMALAGSSRPASGAEHHLSHFFEVQGIRLNKPYLPHGIDVGFSTAITCSLREYLAGMDFSAFEYSYAPEQNARELKRVYGDGADELIKMRDQKELYKNRLDIIIQKEDEIKTALAASPSRADYNEILKKTGFDTALFHSTYGQEYLREAIIYAKDLKDRYTVLRLAENAGELEKFAERTHPSRG